MDLVCGFGEVDVVGNVVVAAGKHFVQRGFDGGPLVQVINTHSRRGSAPPNEDIEADASSALEILQLFKILSFKLFKNAGLFYLGLPPVEYN